MVILLRVFNGVIIAGIFKGAFVIFLTDFPFLRLRYEFQELKCNFAYYFTFHCFSLHCNVSPIKIVLKAYS